MLTFVTWLEIVFVRFIHCKVIFFPSYFFTLYILEESHYGRYTLKEWEVMFHLLNSGEYFDFCKEICLLPTPHLLIYSDIYNRLMNIYFMLWVIIQYYFTYFVGQIVSSLTIGSSFSWFPYPHPCELFIVLFFFKHRLTFWYYKMVQAHPVYFLPQS